MLPVLALLILVGLFFGLSSEQPEPGVSIRARFLSLGVNRSFWYLLTYFFLGMLAHYAVLAWLPTFLRNAFGYSAVRAGLASTLVTIALVVGSPLAGMLSDRLRSRTSVLLLGSILSAVAFALFLFSPGPGVALGAALLSGIGMAFTIPVLVILVGEAFGSSGAGLAVSAAVTTGQIASSLSGMLFGYVLQTRSSFVAVWGLALVIAAGSIPFLLLAVGAIKASKAPFPASATSRQ
jgi:predicted MFS family arabinose efflux permease